MCKNSFKSTYSAQPICHSAFLSYVSSCAIFRPIGRLLPFYQIRFGTIAPLAVIYMMTKSVLFCLECLSIRQLIYLPLYYTQISSHLTIVSAFPSHEVAHPLAVIFVLSDQCFTS